MGQIRITNIQHGCVNDGPGVRTTLFLKGCILRCPWCCNPETLSYEEDYYVNDENCLWMDGTQSEMCLGCERKGGNKSLKLCPFGVYTATSKDYTCEELYDYILSDKYLYDSSRGGVTFSGGEATLQAPQLTPLLISLKTQRIHVAFESTLLTDHELLKDLCEYVNMWIVDIKLQPEMMLDDERYIEKMKERLKLIRSKGCSLIFRLVFVNSMSEVEGIVIEKLAQLGIRNLELIQCHSLGENKYKKLHLEHLKCPADLRQYNNFVEHLRKSGIKVHELKV